MKAKKKEERSPGRWPYWVAAAAAVLAAFFAYAPALHGGFLFDDAALPFALPEFHAPLIGWIRGVRPLLFFTYWLNAQLSGDNPYSYHVVNVLFHCVASGFVFAIVRRLAQWARAAGAAGPAPGSAAGLAAGDSLLAGFAAFLFLLHPVQAEAVAYLAGRSECLSTMFALAAFTVFLYRRRRQASWGTSAGVLLLSVAAILSKEQTAALPALFLLTDFWWNPGFSLAGIRGNWRLYLPLALGWSAVMFYFRDLILHANTAGFGMRDFTWYQYFFTQCRALWIYLREFLLPVGLRADWDFPISKTLLDHGAVFGLAALLALAAAAWRWRRSFPLASYGFFAWLVLMAPTSSFLPIQDPVAERRLYFGMLGLLLVVVDLLGRVKVRNLRAVVACLCAVLLAEAAATCGRAAVWADDLALWKDTVEKSPDKARDRFHLAFAYYAAGRNEAAIAEFQRATQLGTGYVKADMLLDWGLAYANLHQTAQAIAKLREAAALLPTAHVYSQIGMVYGQAGDWEPALDALDQAERLDPSWKFTYFYRGLVYYKTGQFDAAVHEYHRALSIDPTFQMAFDGLREAQAALRAIPPPRPQP
jgi:tetratricopeptide (TPR) repeat protein